MSVLGVPFARLAVVFTLLGLVFSRVSLLVHEFVGHGGTAVGLGGTITDYRLFLFAGGWIRYVRPGGYSLFERLAISLAGIGVELVVAGLALAVAARCRPASLLRVGLVAYATVNLAHAGYYLAVGVHYGIGDGRVLYGLVGDGWERWMVSLPAAIAAVAAAYLGARAFFFQLEPNVAPLRRRYVSVAGAVAIAALAHGALAYVSVALERDQAYSSIMQSDAERRAVLAAARAREQMQREGRPVDARRVEEIRRAALDERRPAPMREILVIAIILAIVLAGRRQGRTMVAGGPWSPRAIGILVLVCAVSVGMVWLLRAP